MTANDKQVSGSHYKPALKGGVQHWDYCTMVDVPNLEYAASKYVQRWRDKNGMVDLNKSIHYLEKRIELACKYPNRWRGATPNSFLFNRYVEANNIPQKESLIIHRIMHWVHIRELQIAIEEINNLIQKEEYRIIEEEGSPTSGYINQDR